MRPNAVLSHCRPTAVSCDARTPAVGLSTSLRGYVYGLTR